MGASPDALCLYQTWFSEAIWFGLDWESLGSTLSAPLLWGIRFLLPLLAVFCFAPLVPLVNFRLWEQCFSQLLDPYSAWHGMDQYIEPYYFFFISIWSSVVERGNCCDRLLPRCFQGYASPVRVKRCICSLLVG